MKSSKPIVTALLLLLFLSTLSAQDASDFGFARSMTSMSEKASIPKQFKTQLSGNKNEIDAIFSGLFLFYKVVLSSQDRNVCSFHPSCSEYGLMSIKQKGLIIGGIMTFDRLARCNGLSPENYEIDMKLRKLKDPVR